VYLHLNFKEPPPVELLRWTIAEKFGWTLEYIDGLTLPDVFEFLLIEEGRGKAMKTQQNLSKGGKRAYR